ncbi:MAG TPA: excinuclease ABC subunit A, partial [Candidatus Dojkabacteria bacterium]|nr:excinuclease ABC subunit A [Candidatus Dojkabacteria bacterium]
MEKIIIKGARSHNLKNIDVEIPKNKLVVITGISGSGKSSLAFDTIYAEGQRKYVESLSAYARQFLGVMEKADVDSITGLSPAIAIDQKTSGNNPRSTVGTVTEISDYLRLLFARAGHPHSPKTGKRLQSQTVQQIVDTIMFLPQKFSQNYVKILLLSPVVKQRKGTYEELFQRFLTQGYLRVRVDKKIYSLEEEIKLDKFKKHDIEIIIDRLVIKKETTRDLSAQTSKDFVKRLTDSVESALNLGNKEIFVSLPDLNQDLFYSEKLMDPETGESFPQIEPHTFSFNSPMGACSRCHGLGNIFEIDEKSVYNPNLSISEGG